MFIQKIIHIRSPHYKGAVTIVSHLIKEDGHSGYLRYGVAYSSPKDTFVKKVGVEIAKQRLNDINPLPVNTNDYNNDMLLMSIISDILLNRAYPRFAKNLLLSKFISERTIHKHRWCW